MVNAKIISLIKSRKQMSQCQWDLKCKIKTKKMNNVAATEGNHSVKVLSLDRALLGESKCISFCV